jgi:hypothetical protein
MTRQQAEAIATALGAKVIRSMPQSRTFGVAYVRPDGRYALIESDAGAVYHDEHACWVGYHTLGDDPRGSVHAEEWGEWGIGERWAHDLAIILGGDSTAHTTGGCNWCVLTTRPDGRCAYLGDCSSAIFPSRDAFHNSDDEEDAEHFDFDPID